MEIILSYRMPVEGSRQEMRRRVKNMNILVLLVGYTLIDLGVHLRNNQLHLLVDMYGVLFLFCSASQPSRGNLLGALLNGIGLKQNINIYMHP